MKNIHVLPTDKPSSLFIIEGKLYNYHKPQQCDGVDKINVNIYITSDEEIKEGDWILKCKNVNDWDFKSGELQEKDYSYFKIKCISLALLNPEDKKIILTTDELYIHNDLIPKEYNPFPQYIQKIDDDFLEWFVKNPSCEEVEVKEEIARYGSHFEYKIIIPKEEQKQELNPLELFFQSSSDACNLECSEQEELENRFAEWWKNNQKDQTIEEVFEWLTTNNYLTDLKETLINNFKNK
jgi:hypothetical protein